MKIRRPPERIRGSIFFDHPTRKPVTTTHNGLTYRQPPERQTLRQTYPAIMNAPAGSTGRLTLTGCRGLLDRVQHPMARDRVVERGAEMRSLAVVVGEPRIVAAIGASLILWGAALWRVGGLARLPAAAGVIVGAVLALGIVIGWLRLTVVGIVVVTLLQGIWIILVAAHLLRGGFNGRDV